MKRLFIGLFLTLFSAPLLFSQALNFSRLDSLFNILQANNQAMGSIAISKDNKIVYRRAIGYSFINTTEKIPATTNTRYRIGSITKLFTSVLIFKLIEKGKLSLNVTLDKFFPEIPGSRQITIKMLLQHRSGLADYVNDPLDTASSWLFNPQTSKAILDVIEKSNPHFEPGIKIRYCNSGYFLLAKIIERIEHKPYNEVLREKILKVLRLQNTSTDSLADPQVDALSFYFDGEWKENADFYFNNLIGVGNILSSPSDLTKLLNALFSGKLIDGQSLDSMMTFPDTIHQFEYGTGIIKFPYRKDNISKAGYGHNGGTFGTTSIAVYFPVDTLAIGICLNGLHSTDDYNKIVLSILDICYNKPVDYKQYTHYPPASSFELDKYLGVYTTGAEPIKLTITKDSLGLVGQLSGQEAYHFEVIGPEKFAFKMVGAVLKFTPSQGQVLFSQEGEKVLFKKMQ